jgi:hypothetical protein
MNVPAGLVNRDGAADDDAFERILTGSSPEVAAVARAVRRLVYEELPTTVEVVWPRQGSVGWGTGEKKATEQFAYLMPATRHVTLGFYFGGDLPDPEGLLPTQGGRQNAGRHSMRSLHLARLADVGRPALRDLIRVSTTVGVPPPR